MSAPTRFHCGPFDLDGFATESNVFPTPWKVALFVLGAAALTMALTVGSTLVSCCRQSVLGKSIHNCTGSAQAAAGIGVMVAIFCHMLGWGANRVHRLCGSEAEPFYAAECGIGKSGANVYEVIFVKYLFANVYFHRLVHVLRYNRCSVVLRVRGFEPEGGIGQHAIAH